jgi:GcrA cell cycle regulator
MRFLISICVFPWFCAPGARPLPKIAEHEMNKTNAALARIAASDGSAPYSAYFTDQEPIDGKITVVDLTDGACRWPTGNPRDLKTFRYCGESARGPYCERHAQLAYLPRAA